MNKRGQATIFIILGLIILAVFLLIFLFKPSLPFMPVSQESLESNIADINDHIQECLQDTGQLALWKIAKQGGYLDLSEGTYRNYYNYDTQEADSISYLGYSIKDKKTCQNRMLTKIHMEQELSEDIKTKSMNCLLNLPVKSRYTQTPVNPQNIKLNVKIGQDSTALLLEYPITLTYNELRAERNKFLTNIQLPLGRLYDTASEIVNSEALLGDFPTLVYSVGKTDLTGKQYIVQKTQPYPDKLYQVKINDIPTENKEYIFQFFIQGEDRFEA